MQLLCHLHYVYCKHKAEHLFGKTAPKPCSFSIYMRLVSLISMVKITGDDLELLPAPSRRGLRVQCSGAEKILSVKSQKLTLSGGKCCPKRHVCFIPVKSF